MEVLHDDQVDVVVNQHLQALSELLLDLLPSLALLVGAGLDDAARHDGSPPVGDPPSDVAAGLVDLQALGKESGGRSSLLRTITVS